MLKIQICKLQRRLSKSFQKVQTLQITITPTLHLLKVDFATNLTNKNKSNSIRPTTNNRSPSVKVAKSRNVEKKSSKRAPFQNLFKSKML